jgi:hypothetical protein
MPVAEVMATLAGKVTGKSGLGVKTINAGVLSTALGSNCTSTVKPVTFSAL